MGFVYVDEPYPVQRRIIYPLVLQSRLHFEGVPYPKRSTKVVSKHVPKAAMVILILGLLLAVMPASAAPTNYCTSVVLTPTQPSGTYTIDAIGAGQWARGVRNGTSTVLWGPTDFGAGATTYHWAGIYLTQGDVVQVQMSHTSATTGYSTTGCITTVPAPLSVILDDYGAWLVPGGAEVYWTTVSEINTRYFEVYRHPAPGLPGTLIHTEQAASPGGTQGAAYSYFDGGIALSKARLYSIRAYSMHGQVTTYGPFRAIAPPSAE